MKTSTLSRPASAIAARTLVLALLLIPVILSAQTVLRQRFPVGSRPPISPFRLNDESGTPLGHYVYVDQLNDTFILELKCGELELRSTGHDTLAIIWDHPLNRTMITPYLPVYEYNSLAFRNGIQSLPFTPLAGDTLFYYRVYGLDFPTLNAERHFIESPGIDSVVVRDSLTWRIEVADALSGATIRVLDDILVTPAGSFSALMEQLADRAIAEHRDLRSTGWWVPDAEERGRAMRVRITPVHHPQRDGNFERRALYCRYRWEDRSSQSAGQLDAWIRAELDRSLDSVLALQKKSLESRTPVMNIDVLPATLARGVARVEVVFPMQETVEGNFVLVNSAGVVLLEVPLASDHAVDRLAVQLDTGALPAGPYFAVVRMNGRTGTRLVQILQ